MTPAALVGLAMVAGAQAFGAETVIFTTDFGFNGRHAYYYVALDKGYYREEGLDVEIVRGNGSADAIKQVAAGRAALGFADAGTLILARGNDQMPVKLVAVVYAKPPHAVYVLAKSGIKKAKDLENKTLADAAGGATRALFPLYAKAAGLDPGKVSWVAADSAALPALLAAGKVDGIGQFVVGEPLLRKTAAPEEIVRLAYADAGLDYYGNGIIASEEMIKTRPKLIRAFVRATLRGMREAFRDPAMAGKILAKHQPQIDPEIGRAETELVKGLVAEDRLGVVDAGRVSLTVKTVSAAFKLRRPVAAKDVFAAGFVDDR